VSFKLRSIGISLQNQWIFIAHIESLISKVVKWISWALWISMTLELSMCTAFTWSHFPQIFPINTSLLPSINDHDMMKENNGSIHKALIKVQSFMCRVRQLHNEGIYINESLLYSNCFCYLPF